ncbi:MAG: hypothetical protein FD123_4019 [Bacteroidetes bacterium]|nr:MAG: hypothetical protein FD123_4019 [Bacteroidota bacterium]
MQLPLRENYRIAISSIKGQKLRALLTMLIIAIGITSLVGTLTAIEAMRYSISSNFQNMGANTFTIRNREMTIRIGRGGKKPRRYKPITYQEAVDFQRTFDFPCYVSVSTVASFNSTLKYRSEKSNPNVQVFGADENYLMTSGYELKKGRNFSITDIQNSAHVCLLGADMVSQLFNKYKEDPLGKTISVGNGKYQVIGVLGSKGNTFGFGGDKLVILPLPNVRQYFSRPNMTFTINVLARDATMLESTVSEATGYFRVVRKVEIGEEDNFEITKSDSLSNLLNENLSTVYFAATGIGIITLIGAAIGLMNIMLVSVTERTREIGTRKALGATRAVILRQFLMESVMISILGGLGGILLGIIIGNLLMMQLSGTFVIPWAWMLGGVTICFVVGIISGIGPAIKASRLDPIEALRFE